MKLLIILLIVPAMFVTGCGCQKRTAKKEAKPVANTHKDVIKDQEVEGLKLTNTALVTEPGNSTLTTEVSNPTGQDIQLLSFDIYVKDKNGNLIITLIGYVGESIPAGQTRTIVSSTDMNLKDATSVEYKINH